MSFGADLKEFVSSFRDTYKAFKPTWQEQSLAEVRAEREAADKVRAGGAAGVGETVAANMGSLKDRAIDTGDTPESGYNPKGKLPAFASSDHLDTAVRTVYGEAANQPPEGQQAVAATLVNRAKASGRGIAAEALRPNQYEPWNNAAARARMLRLKPDDPAYQRIKATIQPVLEGKVDPTNGGTHFYAPAAQRALGRATPSWARGNYQDIGQHRFYRLPYSGQGQHGIGKRAALDLGEEDPALLEEQPVVYAARGGVVPSTLAENAGSNPVTRDVMDAQASEEDDYDPTPLVDVEGARQAVEGGLRFTQRMLGLEAHHAAVPGAVQPDGNALKGLAHGVGAASPEEKQLIRKTIDPQGKLSPELAEIASYNALYKYYKSRGEDGKADRAASSMLMAAKQAATQYGAAALAQSDPRKRAEIIALGYNRLVPDGKSMKITGSDKSGGVKFEVVDPSGKLTEKGAMAVDDIMQLATGMVDGTQWLQSTLGFATSAPTAAEKKDAKNQAAIAQYDAEDDTAVVASMTPNQREALNKMTPDVRARAVEARRKALKMEYTEEQDALKRDDKIENRDYQRDWQQFKTALAQNNFDVKRHDVLTNAEKKFFLYEKDLDDRNKRFDQSQEARKQRDAARAESLLQSRVGRAAAQGIKLPPKVVAEERRIGAIDTTEGQARMAIAGEKQEGNEYGYGAGPSPEQETRMGAISAEAGFNRIPEANRKFDDENYTAIRTGVDKMFGDAKVNPADKMWASRIASDIRRSGSMSNDDAVMMVQHALDPKSPEPIVNPREGTVSFGPNLPAVKMTGESVMALARLRGRARATQAAKEPKPTVRQAIPGATAPVRTTPEDDARARAANRRRAIETWGAPAR